MPGSSGGHTVRMPASGLLHVPPDPTALPLLPLLLSLCLSVCLPDRHQASALCRPLAMAFPFTVPQKSPEALPQAHTFPLELWTLPPLCSGTEKMLRPAGTLALPSPAWPSPSQAFLHGCPCAPCLLLCTRPVSRVSSLLSLGLTLAPLASFLNPLCPAQAEPEDRAVHTARTLSWSSAPNCPDGTLFSNDSPRADREPSGTMGGCPREGARSD